MRAWRSVGLVAAKIIVGSGLFTALIALVRVTGGSQLQVRTLLGYFVVSAMAVLVGMLPWLVLSLTSMQWALKEGGTDSQWFWFPGEPPGLAELRNGAVDGPTSEHRV